ncbi:hypothetical protein D9615_007329 [Tricholomella constricta]|uniref:F-box domain-containing protein n=1 Tax=Tricholomella constricta TaxID=117010 RepID=A0A8H5H5Y3_9AGAR|nr:hypothetical protein D9615_007329 [Tricholomella constricta]
MPTVETERVPQVAAAPASFPLQKLNIDIMLTIFTALLASPDSSPTSPVTLSQVCRSWRDLFLESPTLWTNILVSEELSTTNASLDRAYKRVEAYLARSGGCSLAIQLSFVTWGPQESTEQPEDSPYYHTLPAFFHRLNDIGRAIAKHAARIRTFSLTVDEMECTAAVLGGFGLAKMPLLEAWTVRNTDEEQVSDNPPNNPDALLAEQKEMEAHYALCHPESLIMNHDKVASLYSNLRFLSLHTTPLVWSEFCPRNLVTLEITMLPLVHRPSSADLCHILLANAHSLESLRLDGCVSPDSEWPESCLVPNVEFLQLGFYKSCELLPLLNAIQVPALRRFVLTDIHRQRKDPSERLLSQFDEDIILVLRAIGDKLPIHEIWHAQFEHIALCPSSHQIPLDEAENALKLARRFTVKFFSGWKKLTHLFLHGPDRATLEGLNSILPCSMEMHGTTEPRVPAPALTTLQVENCVASVLGSFLRIRVAHPQSFHALLGLVIKMPRNWFDAVKWDTRNLTVLAKEVFPIYTQLSPEVQTELLQL